MVTSDTVFDPRLRNWIRTFYSVAVVQSAITTGLMAWRIWQAERLGSQYRAGKSNLRPILWILVESASLQFFVELVLLALYAANFNCQYLMLEPVTPLVVCLLEIPIHGNFVSPNVLSRESHSRP